MRITKSRGFAKFVLVLLPAVAIASLPAAAQGKGQGNGNGGGSNGGNVVDQDISARIELLGPEVVGSTGGALTSDGSTEYSDAESGVSCVAGRRRSIHLGTAKRSTRRLLLELGDMLPAMNGDNPRGLPEVSFGETNSHGETIPDPSSGPDGQPGGGDDGEISDIGMFIGLAENVSALGVFPVDGPVYCDSDNVPIEPIPGDHTTFSRMRTNMRMSFKVGDHQWRLYFGPPRNVNEQGGHPTQFATGPVIVERFFDDWPDVEPSDPTPPWTVTIEPWQSMKSPERNGMIVGYLHYRGTKREDPYSYVGAFDVHLASPDPLDPWHPSATPWLVYPVQ